MQLFYSHPGSEGSNPARLLRVGWAADKHPQRCSSSSRRRGCARADLRFEKPASQRSCLLGGAWHSFCSQASFKLQVDHQRLKTADHNFIHGEESSEAPAISAEHLSPRSRLRLFTHLQPRAHRSAASLSCWPGNKSNWSVINHCNLLCVPS